MTLTEIRLPSELESLRRVAEDVACREIAPRAAEVDRDAVWPAHAFRALADAGLMGLTVPKHAGGLGGGLLALAALTEQIAQACPSSALCFGMHCVGAAVIAAKATPYQEERYLRPIAEGRHVTTLAVSESGTGVHFYLPETKLERDGDRYLVAGTKQFVTNGGQADSYVVSTEASVESDVGDFSCLLVDGDTPGITWLAPWEGLGMRGNSSRGMHLDNAPVPAENLLGREGDEIWYIFEVVAPYFLTAMAGTYLGVAHASLQIAIEHVKSRTYGHSGEALGDVPVIQHRLAELWMAVERTRLLIYDAARRGDEGDTTALASILASKASAGDTAVFVANEAMTLCGGMAFRENSTLARLLRDARASHVMSPTTDVLKQWVGRALLGVPLL